MVAKRKRRQGKAAGAVDGELSPRIIDAPARAGVLLPFKPTRLEAGADGTVRVVDDTHQGYCAARVGDVFDRAGSGLASLSPGQVSMARGYAALSERCAASGMRGMALDSTGGGGGGSDCFVQAMIDDHARLRSMVVRIGDGVALPVRRVRPSVRANRVGIKTRYLVDRVCLAGWTLTEVAASCGWAKNVYVSKALCEALAEALDRMQGYR